MIEQAVEVNVRENIGAGHVVLAYDMAASNLAFPVSKYSSIINSRASAEFAKKKAS